MNLRRIPMVEVTGLEPAASWSQTTRATNCATPRSYNLSIIIHKRCGRQVPARQKSYSQAEQPQHQQVRGVEGIEEPLVKRAPAGGAPAVVQVQDHKRGAKDRHSAADGLPHLPAAQPGHAAVEQRRRAERGFLPRSVSLSKNFIIKLRNNRPRLQKSKNIPQKLANKGVSTPSLQASSDSWQQI